MFELARRRGGRARGPALFAVYPFSFFFAVGYTEPLMVAAGAGAMWLALRGRHVWAGLAFAAGVLARAPASLGWLGLAVAQLRDRTRWRTRAALLIPVAVGAAVAAAQLDPLRRSADVDARARSSGAGTGGSTSCAA